MRVPYGIDSQSHRLADILAGPRREHQGRPLDVPTAYFTVGRFSLMREGMLGLGNFGLPLGADPASGGQLRLRPDSKVVKGFFAIIAQYLGDPTEAVRKRVMSMFTDPTRIHPTDPGQVEGNPVFAYHDAFNDDRAEVVELKERYRKGTVGDVEVKQRLFAALERFLSPIRERRRAFAEHPERVREIVVQGTRRGRAAAQATMEEVRAAMRLNYTVLA